ncbi:hypothetical protein AB0892_08305 [Streptomyces sp. NPDC005409]
MLESLAGSSQCGDGQAAASGVRMAAVAAMPAVPLVKVGQGLATLAD